jgi:hypothetical protein
MGVDRQKLVSGVRGFGGGIKQILFIKRLVLILKF